MSDIAIGVATQSAVLEIQRTAALLDTTQNRLATGLEINQPLDNAPAFFLAQSLNDRTHDLLNLKEGISQGISAISAGVAGTKAINQITEQMKALAGSVKGGSAAERAAAAAQFDVFRTQINNLAADTSFGGINLLASTPGSLTINFNENHSSNLTVSGTASDASSLGIASAVSGLNGFATDADIDTAIAQLDQARDRLRSTASGLASNITLLNTRMGFTGHLAQSIQSGADRLTLADLNTEAANFVALKIRQQLALGAAAFSGRAEQSVLQLFQKT